MQMPAVYGAVGTIVSGTPTKAGTFTWSVSVVPFSDPTATPALGTYQVTVTR
ncbi:MAG TPA: hypothetical protein VGS97_14425 [Actinocrinis sp.]|uniref:hypothetical protein n=1 Tax=Actinocrinis sp. TaxID=1920516 RepID=UPI002DDCE98E|nr:hypothetical protein [Actinocrinis sp.]HEV2345291.1 hypothetical protein [Actinocrinis sp.]